MCLRAGIPGYTGISVIAVVCAGLRWYTCMTLRGVECRNTPGAQHRIGTASDVLAQDHAGGIEALPLLWGGS